MKKTAKKTPETALNAEIEGYTWESGKKEPIYKSEPIKPDCLGYTWESGKKEPIKQVILKADGEDKGYTWASGKKEAIK